MILTYWQIKLIPLTINQFEADDELIANIYAKPGKSG